MEERSGKIQATIYLGNQHGWSKVYGKWRHRIIVIDGYKMHFYRNGKLIWTKDVK